MAKPYDYKASARGVSPAAAASPAPVATVTNSDPVAGAGDENPVTEVVAEAVAEAVPASPVEVPAGPELSKADKAALAAGHPTASAMLEMVCDIRAGVSKLHAAAEHHARALVKDHAEHAKFTRLGNALAEFRNAMANV
jgi:hypothetical protein